MSKTREELMNALTEFALDAIRVTAMWIMIFLTSKKEPVKTKQPRR